MPFLSRLFRVRRSLANSAQTPGLLIGRFLAWGLGLMLLSPVVFVLWGVLSGQAGESWPHIQEYLLPEAIGNTLILVVGVAIFSLALGLPAAWVVSQYRFPLRRLLSILLVLPLALPPYIAAYLTTELREATIPWLVQIKQTQGVESYLLIEKFLRYFWLILILSVTLFPYLFLASRAVFSRSSRNLSEASRLLGAKPWRTWRTIHLPLIRPALVAGLFLISMEVVSDYGAAKHLGINTLTVVIFRTWFGLDDLTSARHLAGWLLLTIFVLLSLERWHRGRARFADSQPSRLPLKSCSPTRIFMCWLACGIPVFLGFLYPLFILIKWQWKNTSTELWSSYGQEFFQTLTLGLGATGSCLVLSLLLLAVARLSQKRSDRLFTTIVSTAGYASPGTVMAVGVLGIASWSRQLNDVSTGELWFHSLLVSGSFLWIFFALTARYLTVSSQVIISGYQSIPLGLDQAGRLLGRRLPAIFGTIHLPLLRGPLLSAGVLVFVDVSKELPLTLLLRPFDFETLGTTTYSYANQGLIFSCATPALLLILLSATSLTLVELFGWNKPIKTK